MEIWQADRATVQLWVSIAALALLLLVAPTLAWLVHAFLQFRAKVESRLPEISAAPPPEVMRPALREGSPAPPLVAPLPDYWGADDPRASTEPPPVATPRQTRLPPR